MVERVAAVLQRHGFASSLDSSDGGDVSKKNSTSSDEKVVDFKKDRRWLRAPTFLQSFEPGALAEAHARRGRGENGRLPVGVPLVQLVDEAKTAVPGGGAGWWFDENDKKDNKNKNLTFADLLSDSGLERISKFAHAIGPSVAQVLDFPPPPQLPQRKGSRNDAESVGAFSSLVPRATARGLSVHAYTLRDDLINMDRFKKISNGAVREAEALFSGAQIEGAFGDFPPTLKVAVEEARREKEKKGIV